MASVVFSAQFGGRDAATTVLPHFKALKESAQGIVLNGFPFSELAFILRVDGEVNQYGFSGAGNPDVDRDNKYLSIDIGIEQKDRHVLPDRIASALQDSLHLIDTFINQKMHGDFDISAAEEALAVILKRYLSKAPILDL